MEFWLIGILFPYAVVIFLFRHGWYKTIKSSENPISDDFFISIIIPFKNESLFLPDLLKQFEGQIFPQNRFEVVLVNDHSNDNWQSIEMSNPILKVVDSEGIGKKAAIATGIKVSRGEFIVTTDADCLIGEEWLLSIATWVKTSNSAMVIGPVTIQSDGSFLGDFQMMDYCALQVCGAGAANLGHPLYSSGANFVFRKDKWFELNEFQSGQHLASGDDVFLLHAFKKANQPISFLKNSKALVQTRALSGWKNVLNQRARWGGKSKAYSDNESILLALLVLATNLWLVVLILLLPFYIGVLPVLLLSLAFKSFADFFLLFSAIPFFNVKFQYSRFFMFLVIHPFWIVVSAFYGIFKPETWK